MMHSTPIRTMCLVVGMIMLMVSTGYGTDADGKYTAYGHGTDSCNKYLNVMSGVTEKVVKNRTSSNPNTLPGFNIPEPQPIADEYAATYVRRRLEWLDARREYLIQVAREQAKHDTIPTDQYYYINWIAGYLTAVNLKTADTYNILGKSDIDGAMLWIKNYCNNNPIENIIHAIEALVNDLYQNRLTKAPVDNMKR